MLVYKLDDFWLRDKSKVLSNNILLLRYQDLVINEQKIAGIEAKRFKIVNEFFSSLVNACLAHTRSL